MLGATCAVFLSGVALGQKINLPDGKGKAELIRSCTACHDADLIVRVKKTPEDWKKTVYEMADRGVDASDEELNTIVRYLSANFGIKKSAAAGHRETSAPKEASTAKTGSVVATRYLASFPKMPDESAQK
jgi:hypothetical protein